MSETADRRELSPSHEIPADRQQIQLIAGMASSIAQDFSNWVGIIAGHAASIAEHLIPRTRAHEEALGILDATKHAGGSIKRLLSFARSVKGDGEQFIESVAIREVVDDAIAVARDAFADDSVSFSRSGLDNVPQVRADAGQFLELLLNLFRNAVDAMPQGGTITVDASKRAVNHTDYVVLRVRDNGTGMTPDVRRRIFEPFFSTKSDSSGLGLGLTVVCSLVESWGGMLKVRSTFGHGSSFRLFLPQVPTSTVMAREQQEPINATVLVVDDDERCLEELKAVLVGEGYRTLTARSGEEGLALFERHAKNISLVVIDVVMPGTDGKQLLSKILESDPTAQIIMTSGFSRDYVRTYLEVGAWGFVQKPVNVDQLKRIARKMLGQRRVSTGVAAL
jgi:nitrogen-specific signal transduction histidine kinase/CheY-like chemotaxis protein